MTTNSTITRSCIPLSLVVISFLFLPGCNKRTSDRSWTVNKLEYLEKPGLSVLVFHDFYPVGKQGGVEIIQHGQRIATNGFIRMEQVNGERFDDPARATREIDSINHLITAKVNYEDFNFGYSVTVQPDGDAFKLKVDLDKPIPAAWKDKLYFQMEIYPPLYYGKTFQLGSAFGIVTRQGNGPLIKDENGRLRSASMGQGKKLVLAAEDPMRNLVIEDETGKLTLMDERNVSNRGWLVVKSNVPSEVTDGAIEWTIRPHVVSGWTREPMIAVSQVGYDPDQVKQAIIETEPGSKAGRVSLLKVTGEDGAKEVLSESPQRWGKFLRYDYAIFDFSSVHEPGMYRVRAGDVMSDPFAI
ncbi:MAG TPA: cellulase N-terminal Ig-like domain-containing protein, partial [Chryseosolibacter sp.]